MGKAMGMEDFIGLLGRERCSAILRTPLAEAAAPAMEAAVAGGFRVIEFTLTTPGALDLIASFAGREGLAVGAGTVLDPEQAREAVRAGARFLVSPVVDPAVIAEGRALGVPVMPGTHTPTEMHAAWRAGAPLQKVFPAPAGGPAAIRACLGPLPFLRLVPTHGVDEASAREWLDAGAFAVGFVTPLFPPEDLASGRFDRIEGRARRLRAAVAR